MKGRRGFTLIELLAVIIILAIIMLIAIPGVTNYINNSRKNVYVDTAKELVKGASTLLNSGDLPTLDPDVTYYVDSRCIANETGKDAQSPFGKFNPAYVMVINEDDEYNYYFQSRDEKEIGVKDITKLDNLEISKIVSDVKEEDIDTSVGIGNTTKTAVIDENCEVGEVRVASRRVSRDGEARVTLTFDNQGGNGCTSQSQYYGDEWGKLCRPKKTGYRFMGWYTEENGKGDKIKAEDIALKSLIVYAKWIEKQEATFDTGPNIYSKMRFLSGESYTYTGSSIVKYFRMAEEEPGEEHMQSENIVSSSTSAAPIYLWFDEIDASLNWWSIDDEPSLNANAQKMFYGLSQITEIEGIELFDTSNVTNMSNMFSSCMSITSLDLSNFDTSNVTDMSEMFSSMYEIQELDLSDFNTSKVRKMSAMFSGCTKLQKVDVSGFNTSLITNMSHLFYKCSNLERIDLRHFNTLSVYEMDNMFYDCTKLTDVYLNFNVENVVRMESMFSNCKSLVNLDLSSFVPTNVVNVSSMFSNCSKLQTVVLSNFSTPNAKYFSYMFYECNELLTVDFSGFNVSKVENMDYMFEKCNAIQRIDLSSFYTNSLTSCSRIFENCTNAKNIILTHFDTSKLTVLEGMFHNCQKLESLDLSSFDTSNVTTFGCRHVMGNQNGQSTVGTGMFSGCKALTELDLSNFNTSKALYMGQMFTACQNLKSLNISSFDTSNVTHMGGMFYLCESIETIDLSNFEFDSCMNTFEMFGWCYKLKTIYVTNSMNLDQITMYYNMFKFCYELEGGAGTVWNESMSHNKNYAKVDGGESAPGLFTLKV